jgi:parvulin-like peptidyl-prolyl isomerase
MRRHRLILLLASAALLAVLAGCGGSGEKDSLDQSTTGATTAAATGSTGAEATGAEATGATSAADATATEAAGSTAPELAMGELGPNEVANVAGRGITKDEFDRLLEIARAQAKSQGSEPPAAGSPEDDTLRRQVMQVLVQNTIVEAEAERQGVALDEEKLATELEDFKQQCCEGKAEEYEKYLKDSGATEQDLKDQLATRQLAQALYDKVTADVSVTDEQVAEQYEQDKETRYTTAESRKVAHILIDVAPTGTVDDKDLKKANEVLALVKKGDDFGDLAKKYSADPGSKDSGGEYDDVRGTFVAEFEEAAFSLKTGEFTQKPVKSQFGYHIIKALADVKPESVQPLDEVQEQIKQELEQTAKDTAANEWYQKLLDDYERRTVFAPGYGLPPEVDTAGTLPEGTTLPESDTAATDATGTDATGAEATTDDAGTGSEVETGDDTTGADTAGAESETETSG